MSSERHVLVDTSVLYPADDSSGLHVTDGERERANEIVGAIHDGDLPQARVLTSVQQEVFDHLHNEAGQDAVRSMLGFLRESPNFEFHNPQRDVIVAGRQIMEQRADFEFTDGQIAAYLNQLDQEHRVVYTVDGKFDSFPGITALPTAYDPYS
jgi:predicted nucleic acid-binding protein